MDNTQFIIRQFKNNDLEQMVRIWNEVVDDGIAFPQTEDLDVESAEAFFSSQSFTGVAVSETTNEIAGLYILHPNNIGRCGHIANSSYAVSSKARGNGIGEKLVAHSLVKAKETGFRILQFNAVVSTNTYALKLYKKLGFVQMTTIPNGFLMKNGEYVDIIPHYKTL